MTNPLRNCCACGEPMPGAHHLRRACSDACKKVLRSRQRWKRLGRTPRECRICGKPIERRKSAVTCSPACRREKDRIEAIARRRRNNKAYRETDRLRYARNRKKIMAQGRERYRRNREEILKKRRAEYRANPEKIKAQNKRRYWKNPEKARALRAKWYAENREHARELDRKRRERDGDKRRSSQNRRYVERAAALEFIKEELGPDFARILMDFAKQHGAEDETGKTE